MSVAIQKSNRELSLQISELLKKMGKLEYSSNPVAYASLPTEAFWLVEIMEKMDFHWSIASKRFYLTIYDCTLAADFETTAQMPRAIAQTCYTALLKEYERQS